MLRQKCKDFILKLQKTGDNQLTTLEVLLDSYGWYNSANVTDEESKVELLSEALYKYLFDAFDHILTQNLELGSEAAKDLLDE